MDWLHHLRSKKKAGLEEEILSKQNTKLFEDAMSKTMNTPDVADLSNKIGAVIFVYNDLMKRRRDHELLEHLHFAGDAYTLMEVNGWYRRKDALPIVLFPQILSRIPAWTCEIERDEDGEIRRRKSTQHNAHAAIIKGEVYVIKANKLYELDLYHDNGVQFIRQRIDIHIPYEEELLTRDKQVAYSGIYHHHRKAWAYIGNPFYWWGEKDKEGLPFGRAVPYNSSWKNGSDNFINDIDFTPMPIHTPKKTWRQLYYYHDPRSIK